MGKLLFVDDDREVLDLNKKYFEQLGHTIETASSAREAFDILSKFKPDCILLDVMMPEIDGFEAMPKIKKLSNDAPVIFLTGKISEDDKVNGLLLGADDYIEKPYGLKELDARIQVQIRRHKPAKANSNILDIAPLSLDIINHKAFFNDIEIPLSNREYELLFILAQNANNLVNFEDIGAKFFGTYTESDRRTVMVTASRMRKKIEDYTSLDNIIETVYSKGYILRTKK